MAAERPQKTLADYVAIAISPVLIMALVGSLVFFLLEVVYVGQYHGRLQWLLFFFVFGAVLIARISMTSEIADRAAAYGFILGLLVWIALLIYVEYPPGSRFANIGWLINLVLIAIIWWSAHRLTWDCTLIDDTKDASGAGLLEAANPGQQPQPAPQEAPKEEGKRMKEPRGLAGWWHRYRQYREEQGQRPHSPGVWVVYFSLAALPLFGLGQMLISANTTRTAAQKASAQSYSFFLMVIYVASGMGLLLTTSFLNLRRYLRQRGVHMPAAVTSAWLMIGALLIGALLSVGAFLPRPTGDFQGFLEWTGVRSPQRKASNQARDGDGTGKDKGRGAADKQKDKDSKGSGRDGKGKEQGGEGSDKGKSDDKKGGGDKSGRDKGEKGDGEGGGGQDGGEQRADDSSSFPDLRLSDEAANVLKWIVGIIVVLVVLYFLFRSGLRWLANFTDWARRLLEALRAFWEGLWGRGSSATEAGAAEAAKPRPPRPFAAYRDPFGRGTADDMIPADLVQYSFEALEAWARERHLQRQVGETALEFAERVGDEFPVLEEDARRLALLYAGLAYAGGSFPAEGRAALRHFWQILMDATERPLSAGVG